MHSPQHFQVRSSQPLESKNGRENLSFQAHLSQVLPVGMHAIIDTGCQRTAIGRNTLNQIAAALPHHLPVKYANQRFRFAGIGGETITTQVAKLPVLFGRKPGMLRAAILEDTPDAPLLVSLPILRALGTNLNLSSHQLRYQAIGEVGTMETNERGQLCLRLFDFDNAAANFHSEETSWSPRKMVGDECIVFFMQKSVGEPNEHGPAAHAEMLACDQSSCVQPSISPSQFCNSSGISRDNDSINLGVIRFLGTESRSIE